VFGHLMARVIAVACFVLCFAAGGFADDGGSTVTVELRALGARHSPLWPLALVVTGKNTTADKTVSLARIAVEAPTELRSVLPTSMSEPRISTTLQRDLPAGSSFETVVTVPFERPPIALKDFGWLLLSAGTYTFRAVVDYKDEQNIELHSSTELPLRFDAPFIVLMLGALLGALLIGVLRTWMTLIQRRRAGTLTGSVWAGEIFALTFLELPVSLLTAVLAMVLARISTDFQGVLRVELNDIWAGVLVGLLAQSTTGPIAEALGRVVVVPPATPATPPAPAALAPPPPAAPVVMPPTLVPPAAPAISGASS
jgi:hypothetical protein